MEDSEVGSLEQMRAFLAGSGDLRFAGGDELVKMYLNMIPIGRPAEAVEIVNAAVFLSSDQSLYDGRRI